MHKVVVTLISLLCVFLIWGYMADEAGAATTSSGSSGSGDSAIERAATATGNGISRAGTATKNGVTRAATATGNGLKRAATATDHGVRKAGNATVNGVKRGATATANGLNRAGTATKSAVQKVVPVKKSTSAREDTTSSIDSVRLVGARVVGSIPASGASVKAAPKRASLRYDASVNAPAPKSPSFGQQLGLHGADDPLDLRSGAALVVDRLTGETIFEKNSTAVLPIASITKLMTALVVVEAQQPLEESISIGQDDIDTEKNTRSRLKVGLELSRDDALHLALMASENRAASALGRHYPGGIHSFVEAMNAKAQLLGMADTHYVDSNGLSPQNQSSARDLVRLMSAAFQHPLIREYSTSQSYALPTTKGREIQFGTTNRLVLNPNWEIGLQKTGFINEAGQCLIMQAMIEGRDVWIVLLDSQGKLSRIGDAGRVRNWLESPAAATRHNTLSLSSPTAARM
ncbi:hypothetical protein BH10PSE17_BH10PSE17_36540 [soil metagenome]